jgi:tRNA (guanine37-N1)-methyltransferase
MVEELSAFSQLVLICGHYEGVDERIRQHLVDGEISVGDYVLTGGEIPAMVIVDAVSRLIPGVLGNNESVEAESFSMGLLEYPQYTRPGEYNGWVVPDVLLSGHHREIAAWRRRESLKRTWKRRPDLLKHDQLSQEDKQFLDKIKTDCGD